MLLDFELPGHDNCLTVLYSETLDHSSVVGNILAATLGPSLGIVELYLTNPSFDEDDNGPL